MEYQGDIATIQRKVAETSGLDRRLAVLEALDVQPGERVLEVGCGALWRRLSEKPAALSALTSV